MKITNRRINCLLFSVLAGLILISCGGQDLGQNKRLAEAKRNVGEAYMRQGNYTAALHELLQAEKLNPEDHILQNDLGLCYMNKKSMAEAISHFKIAVTLKPSYAPARNNLGTAYLALEEWDAAINIFKEITKDALYGTPHYPLSNLGLAYYKKGQYKTALRYYKEALKINEDFVNALRGAGRTYLAMNQGRMAMRYLERAVLQAPKSPEINFELGEAYLLIGKIKQAKASYESAVELAMPESDVSLKAKRRLDALR